MGSSVDIIIGTSETGWRFNCIKKPLEVPLEFQEETQAVFQADFHYCIFTDYTCVFGEWDSQAVFQAESQAEIYAIELPPS